MTLICKTAGESHGPCGIVLIEGLPAGLTLDVGFINNELHRRQGGYGRGGRQAIENDEVQFLSGVRRGVTTGAPLVVQVVNKDSRLDDLEATPSIHKPRPGHADLAGSIKWLTNDCRNTLERASHRSAHTYHWCARCTVTEFHRRHSGRGKPLVTLSASRGMRWRAWALKPVFLSKTSRTGLFEKPVSVIFF